jgi:magnesium chelatase subunit D
VALISFRGERAEVLLRPSRSVELAKRALDALPAGGGTPLAAGLHAALELATERQADARRVLLVLMTDGRANVETEPITLEAVCAAVRAEGIASVVIDNRDRSVAGGETERLARLLGGRQIYLPRTRAGSISDAVAELTEAMRT